ncbi:Flp pilus assembly complex ATPase component TadA, partial [Candidatus Parcubacteria bacterium]|nr:Flp pilus assembly complex ATPase component TadA [Candidatus Parcubacteria bacterium]
MNQEYLKKVYDHLISSKIADKEQLDKVFEEASKKNLDIFDVLVEKKVVNEEELVKIKANLLSIPYINLKEVVVDNAVLRELPEKAALFYKFIPFEKVGSDIKIAMVDPTNIDALDALKFISVKQNLNTKIYITSTANFNIVTKQYKKFGEELENVLKNVDQKLVGEKEPKRKEKEKERILEEAPVAKIVDIIISHAVEGKASDIHIEPSENDLRVRYRLDGVLHNSLVLPKMIKAAVVSRIKILSNLKIDETRKPQDGRFRFDLSSG